WSEFGRAAARGDGFASVGRSRTSFGGKPASSACRRTEYTASGEQLLHHARRLDAGEALVQPLVAEAEPAVVEAEQVQHAGVEVANVHRILDDVVAEVVGLAVDR